MTAELHLACAARIDYLPHCATMLSSLREHHSGPLRVHLLIGDDVPSKHLDELGAMLAESGAELERRRVATADVRGLSVSATLPLSHWYRVLLPHILDGIDRVLYVDCDVLVADSPGPLIDVELGGRPLGAVVNVFPDPRTGAAYAAGLGLSPEAYFNTGVLALDLEALRAAEVPKRVLEYARRANGLLLHEQDAVNAVLGGDWAPLDPRWNVMLGMRRFPWAADLLGAEAVERAIARPGFLHYEGSGANKPWHPEADPADRELYARHRARTPWPEIGAGPGGA